MMQVEHIAARIMVTATGRIHQTGRVVLLGPFSYFHRLELSPSLVERHPGTDARIRVQAIHNLFPLLAVIAFGLGGTLSFRTVEILAHLPFRIAVAARHILPYNHSQLVAIGIPTGRLHFDVLADHIETEILRLLNVIQQGLVRRSRVQAVGPPTLVERTELEQCFIVQLQTHNPVRIPAGGILTHGRIAVHLVHNLASILQSHLQGIKERRIRTPQLGVLRHGYLYGFSVDTLAGSHRLFAVIHIHFHKVRGSSRIQLSLYRQQVAVDVRRNAEVLDMLSADRLDHTVCQMPLTGVYQMPSGLLTCLPRG